MPLANFDPLIAEWFHEQFGAPTEPQILGWPEIRTGDDVLISAPTGSGKTLAAFLICLDQLVCEARTGDLRLDLTLRWSDGQTTNSYSSRID